MIRVRLLSEGLYSVVWTAPGAAAHEAVRRRDELPQAIVTEVTRQTLMNEAAERLDDGTPIEWVFDDSALEIRGEDSPEE